MATDKSEPRVGLIIRIGILSIVILMVVRVALGAYFDEITQSEEHRKIVEARPEALLSLRSDEQKRLTEGPVPIVQAMHQLAAKGRGAASPDIAPIESKDLAPLQGWSRMPAAVPLPMVTGAASAAAAPGAPAPSSSGAPAPSTPGGPVPPTAPGRSTRPPAGGPPAAPGAPKIKP